ncbi:hypothetical protein AMJ83_03860 [candidate division WOR_3 bacterium SM23_42]|uniref:Uncharacterized protein n=1 Tax=candidate division WOR_3 bacterium SM23_42 TaxID=1703779 RepID=A0A0S8FWN7_UNCW3|nr:MAG: hypothetical protein AMJ83_03860 [candidate division WOR_3 bacterium SM23_42]
MIIFERFLSLRLPLMTGTPRNDRISKEFFIYLRGIRNNPILPIIIARSILFPDLPRRSKRCRQMFNGYETRFVYRKRVTFKKKYDIIVHRDNTIDVTIINVFVSYFEFGRINLYMIILKSTPR